MALVSGRRSTLNPDAPLFIPAAFRQIEDFSPEWWQLVTNSTWYHDYWLGQQQNTDSFYDFDNTADLLPDTFDVEADEDILSMEAQFEEFIRSCTEEHKPTLSSNEVHKNVMAMNGEAMKKNMNLITSFPGGVPKVGGEPAKYAEKAPKRASASASARYSPRFIQQPR